MAAYICTFIITANILPRQRHKPAEVKAMKQAIGYIRVSTEQQAYMLYPQHPVLPVARAAWIGGQGMLPYEQNTQQSPGLGFSTVLQLGHS